MTLLKSLAQVAATLAVAGNFFIASAFDMSRTDNVSHLLTFTEDIPDVRIVQIAVYLLLLFATAQPSLIFFLADIMARTPTAQPARSNPYGSKTWPSTVK